MQKVGLHLRFGRTALSDLWVANSSYTKALDDPGLLAGAHGLMSLRLFIGEGNQQYQSRDPVAFADQMIGRANNPQIILEPTNECGDDDIGNYLGWLAAFTSHAHARGYQVAGFSFAEGHPPDMSLWVTIAQAGFAGVNYLGCHNYWPDGTSPGFEQYHGLRHELANQVLAANGFGNHPPWLISECGHQNGWANNGLNAQAAAAEFVAYDAHIAMDPTVRGAAAYTRGGAPDFWMFETDPIASVLFQSGGDPCAGLQCPAGTVCVNGGCVGSGDPCANVFCPGLSYCVNGSCQCDPPNVWDANGFCSAPGAVIGGLDPAQVVGAALVGGVVAFGALFIRRQIRHGEPLHTVPTYHPTFHPNPPGYRPTWHPNARPTAR